MEESSCGAVFVTGCWCSGKVCKIGAGENTREYLSDDTQSHRSDDNPARDLEIKDYSINVASYLARSMTLNLYKASQS